MATTRAWFLGLFVLLTASCGTPQSPVPEAVELDTETPIINGRFSTAREYPATGALLIRGVDAERQRFGATCTGTLIAPDVVLTAAHCQEEAPGNRTKYFFSLARDVTMAGENMRSMPNRTYAVRSTWPHTQYALGDAAGLGRTNDVALVFLERPVTGVVPARMLAPSEAGVVRVNAPVDIVGYGVRTEPGSDDEAAPSEAPGDSRETIEKSLARSLISEVGAYELQIGHGLPEPEKCYGDSGGPSYIDTPGGKRLVGITSHVYDASGFRRGTVDERVDAYFDWANQTMQDACDNGKRIDSACRVAAH